MPQWKQRWDASYFGGRRDVGTMTVKDASEDKATQALRNLVTELWYACSSPLAMPKRFNPIETHGPAISFFFNRKSVYYPM